MDFIVYEHNGFEVPCDCCEDECPETDRFMTGAPVFVCRECMTFLRDLPDYFEELLEEYLSGNVL
jgi:hypothetical protein